MNTWNDAIHRIQELDQRYADRTARKGLTTVFAWCARQGIDGEIAQFANVAPISNLRTAASELHRAIRWDDRQAVKDILKLCAMLENSDLRLALHLVDLEDIQVGMVDGRYALFLSEGQFRELRQCMKLRHRYMVHGEVEPIEQRETHAAFQ